MSARSPPSRRFFQPTFQGYSTVNQRRINSLAAAITLSLVATGAQAAERTDLHKRNIAQLK